MRPLSTTQRGTPSRNFNILLSFLDTYFLAARQDDLFCEFLLYTFLVFSRFPNKEILPIA